MVCLTFADNHDVKRYNVEIGSSRKFITETLNVDYLTYNSIGLTVFKTPVEAATIRMQQQQQLQASGLFIENYLSSTAVPFDWEWFEDSFTSSGGELSHWSSDNALHITPGAIPPGEMWLIGGRIHTQLDEIAESLSHLSNYNDYNFLPGSWQFRSSVVEYRIISIDDNTDSYQAPFNQQFKKPVSITIKHTVSKTNSEAIRVFCIQDNNFIEEINARSGSNESNSSATYELNGDCVTIETYDFCLFFVCVCQHKSVNKDIQSINAIAYGKICKDQSEYKAEVDFELQFLSEDSVERLPEFWQVSISPNNFKYVL